MKMLISIQSLLFMQGNAHENIVCKLSAILLRHQCINTPLQRDWTTLSILRRKQMRVTSTLSRHYQVEKADDLMGIYNKFKIFITRVAIRMTTKWRKQPSWTEFSPHLLNFIRRIPSFMHECYMNVHVILIHKATCLVSGKWHAIFGICFSRDSYLIFMNSRCVLTRYREQSKNPKLIHLPSAITCRT